MDAGRVYVVSGADGSTLRTHDGLAAGDWFGSGTGALGDIDRDRRPDYVVGAKDAGRGDRGEAYVLSGRTGELVHTLTANQCSVDMGWFFVASAGDVDRDGFDDVYAGDFCALDDVGGCSAPRGQAYVFSGRDGRRLHVFRGAEPGDGAGPGGSAGDVNGDGFADVAVGLYQSSAGAPTAGRVVVYSGRNGRVLADLVSTVATEAFGFDAVGLGDVNADGRVDLLVSAAIGDTVYVVGT